MNQQVRFNLLRGAEREFHMSAVHGIASLKGNYSPPAHASEFCAHFGWSQTQIAEIIVRRDLGSFQLPSDVPRIRLVDGIIRARVGSASAGENCLGLGFAVSLPDFFHV